MGAGDRFSSASSRAGQSARKAAREAYDFVVKPPFLENRLEGASTAGQWIAAAALIILVPVTFKLVLVAANVTESLAFGLSFLSDRQNTPFVVTLLNLVYLVIASWFWFQWVRTAGFGITNMNLGGDE